MMANEFPVQMHFAPISYNREIDNFSDVSTSGNKITHSRRLMLKEQNVQIKDTNFNINNFQIPISFNYGEHQSDLENNTYSDKFKCYVDNLNEDKIHSSLRSGGLSNRNCRQVSKENFSFNTCEGYDTDETCNNNVLHSLDKNGCKKSLRDNCRFQKSLVYNRRNNSNLYMHPFTSQQTTGNHNRAKSTSRFVRNRKKISSEEMEKRLHGLMERFTSRANLLLVNPLMEVHKSGSVWDELNQDIWEMYLRKAQKKENYLEKLQLWRKLYFHLGSLFERFGLFMVGSTMSGLATDNSDIDVCLLVRMFLDDPRSDSVRYLQIIQYYFQQSDFVSCPEIIHAKVPILKFTDLEKKFQVDLNCNNSVGIRNTHLLHCYAHADWRVQPLVIVVKLWAQINRINDAKNMTISSYSLALMVIHYLQCGVSPQVVPCLHHLYPDKFSPDVEIYQIDVQEQLPPFFSSNKQSLGELLIGFLHYYTYFNYDLFAISVRVGSLIPVDQCRYARAPKNDPHQWKLLCIEEPFDLTNTARSVYDFETFKRIKRVFHASYVKLVQNKRLEAIVTSCLDGGDELR